MVGESVGPYLVLAKLGEGGMGAVFRARDTRLGRDVALKVLPAAVAADPERIARFRREAQVLAALNHPHIAHIYGLEESETGDQVRAIVMELVDGPTLADRLATGPIPFAEMLPIAKQIAEALEAAHEQGIVHRDLKPANIAFTPDGAVKVLDFGLAKAMDSPAVSSSIQLTQSPTLTSPVMVSGVGVILGTAAYMAPEQAKGRVADKRSDVWAFGCVLYEMLTGRRAFEGEDLTDMIAAVMRGEPDWSAIPSDVPAPIVTLIKRCLDKDRRTRIGDIAVARFVLADPSAPATTPAAAMLSRPSGLMRMLPWAVAGVAAAAAIATLVAWAPWRSTPPAPRVRFTVAPSDLDLTLASAQRDFAISPDGTHLVYVVGTNANNTALWVRAVDQLDAVKLDVTTPIAPFVSSDSQWIAFASGTVLKKVAMTGGPAIALCGLSERNSNSFRGGTWVGNDRIVFATANPATGLLSVPAGGGEAKVLTTPDAKQGEGDHFFPSALPGGKAVLFTITTGAQGVGNSTIAALDLDTGARKILIRGGSQAEYVDGFIVYQAAGALRAVRFDPARLEVLGDPVPVLDRVDIKNQSGAASYSVSRTGALVYLPGSGTASSGPQRTLVWVDRRGNEEPITMAPARAYQRAAVSPDGTRLALDVRDQDQDIWIYDLAHGTLDRLTTDPAQDSYPVWTADSRRVIFASSRAGSPNLYMQLADRSAPAERLTESMTSQSPMSVTPGGDLILRDARPSADLMLLRLGAKREAGPLVQTQFEEHNGIVSPDGHWLAYDANDTGEFQVYVRPFPNVNTGRWQVSTKGGRAPLWSPSGRELFYQDVNNRLTTVSVQPSPNGVFNFGTPATLFQTTYFTPTPTRGYDISHDGQKFLMIKQPGESSSATGAPPIHSMVVVLNWIDELKQRIPAK